MFTKFYKGGLHYNIRDKINQYEGKGKILRLMHIASISKALYPEALKVAYEECKKNSKDIYLCKALHKALLSQGFEQDSSTWITEREKELAQEKAPFTSVLESYMTQSTEDLTPLTVSRTRFKNDSNCRICILTNRFT